MKWIHLILFAASVNAQTVMQFDTNGQADVQPITSEKIIAIEASRSSWSEIRAAEESSPYAFPNGFSITDGDTGARVGVTISDGELITYSGATNKSTAVAARRAIRQDLRTIRTSLNASIDAATINVADAQAIRDGVTNSLATLQRAVQVQTNSSTANVRAAVIDIQAQQIALATEQRKLAAEQIDAAREQKAALQHVRDLLNQLLASMKDTSTNSVP